MEIQFFGITRSQRKQRERETKSEEKNIREFVVKGRKRRKKEREKWRAEERKKERASRA